jgi:hypothetical protein
MKNHRKKMNHWTLGYAIFVPPNSSTLEVDVSFQWRLKWKKMLKPAELDF